MDEAEIDAILRATTPGIGFFAGVTALALALPHVAFGYLVVAILLVAGARSDEPARPSDARA